MLSIKIKFLLTVKPTYFSNPFGISSDFSNQTYQFLEVSIFLVHLRLILQFLCAKLIFLSKQSTACPALVTWFKAFFIICSRDKIFIKVLFYHQSTIPILIKNRCNELINYIFIINAYNLVTKSTRNMLLIFFSIGTFY